ncbi:MAG: hypothetical protein KA444_01185 [Bacteroidia bacterium]|nr:hypothetical protein [Bacteroidia bacterium]
MKKLLLVLMFLTGVTYINAQEVERNPMDTLTSNVAALNSSMEVLKRLKITGYIQAQFQYADSAGQPSAAGGNFKSGVDKRFSVRRGRIKFTYSSPLNDRGFSTSQYVLQLDVTEKGLAIKDAYILLTDKWTGWFQLKGGMFDRPFGYEIGYSSSMRETPERSRVTIASFPGERDLGATIAIQGPKSGNWNWLRIEGGLFNGVGAPGPGEDMSDFDKMKDFIGRISMNRSTASEKMKYGFGASYYNGGFRVDNDTVYSVGTDATGAKAFKVENSTFKGQYSERNYMGVDAQVSVDWFPGITSVRVEYLAGDQPGTSSNVISARAPVTSNLYKRKFDGAYIYFIQNLGSSPVQAIVKYDWFDPNTDVKGNEIGKAVSSGYKSLSPSDLRYDTWGFGLAYRWDSHVKLTAYYDMVTNETSENLPATSSRPSYQKDLPDNVVTLRLQIKF